MQLADLALGHRDDADAEEGDNLEEGGRVCLVARQAVEALRDDYVIHAIAAVLDELLVARPKRGGATKGMIGIGRAQLKTLLLDEAGAEPDLIVDRSITLVLRGITGVDDGAHVRTGFHSDHLADPSRALTAATA